CHGADLEPRAGIAGLATGDDVLARSAQEVARGVELLDPVIGGVGDVNVARRVGGDPGGAVELAPKAAADTRLAVRRHGADLEPGAGIAGVASGDHVLAPGAVPGVGELL